MMQDVPARIDHKRPREKFEGLQTYDFGIPENDYSWKTEGAQRLLYNLTEKDRFERMKVNQKLPDHLLRDVKNTAKAMDKVQDCTEFLTKMGEEFKN